MADVPGLAATRSLTLINQAAIPDTYVGEGTIYVDASGTLFYKNSSGTVVNLSAGGGGGGGTVTSVGLNPDAGAVLSVTSSTTNPITSAGVFTLGFTSHGGNLIFATPDLSSGVPTFRSSTLNDLPAATAQTVLRSPGTAGASSGTPVYGNIYAPDMRAPTSTSGYVLTSTGTVTAPTWQPAAGGGITALTGDVTASGTGSVAATVASVGGSSAANVNSATTKVLAASTNGYVLTANGTAGGASFQPAAASGGVAAVAATATVAALNTAYYSGASTVSMTLPAPSTITAGQMAQIHFYNNGTGAITITGAVYYGTLQSTTNAALVGRGSYVILQANSTDTAWTASTTSGIININ